MKKLTLLSTLFITVLMVNAQWEWQNPLPQGNPLNDVMFVNENNGWSIGSNGTILPTENGGTVDIENLSLVEVGQISSNSYPNPFTSSTTLSYEFQQPSTIQLTIYNHFGQEVDFIQRNQPQGKQQITWDASDQPSGMYFARLKTTQGSETIKLIKLD